MTSRILSTIAIGLALVLGLPANAQEDPQDEVKGSDFVMPISCAKTTIKTKRDRFGKGPPGSAEYGGMTIAFANGVGLISYTVNKLAARERVGDSVQVCFLGRIEGGEGCLTADDSRGRVYRVYDYRLHVAYTMTNSQHRCGGA